MLAQQRQEFILAKIRSDGAVRVADLVSDLGVSDMTIRRDLGTLSEAGLLSKVHGGATAMPDSASFEPGFAVKATQQRQAKLAIAAEAARLVRPGSAIGMSAGTTTFAVAEQIADVPGLTVVTNSVPIADMLHRSDRRDSTVILTGGMRTPSDALVGPFAVAALRTIHLDLVFMGVHGMDDASGFMTPNLQEAETNRALVDAGKRLVVVADHTKWGIIGISSIARLDEADIFITDADIDPGAADILRDKVGSLVVVRPAPAGATK